jgi:hypothetical protein
MRVEVEILVLGKPEHRHRQIVVGARFLAEEDRIFALCFAELGREDGHAADVVPELHRAARDDAQILVLHIVQEDVTRHRVSWISRSITAKEKGRSFSGLFPIPDGPPGRSLRT